MALGTDTTSGGLTPMAAAPGISPVSLSVTPDQGNRLSGAGAASMGTPAQSPETPPAPPFLFSDLEPVHFARLYPEALSQGGTAAADAAMAAGQAAYDLSKTVISSVEQDQLDQAAAASTVSGGGGTSTTGGGASTTGGGTSTVGGGA